MMDLIHELWFLKRDIVSDDYDHALYRLAEEMPMTIHKYPSGETCWTWTIPEKWTCHEAYLETIDGRRLIDYAKHPLHVVSYSLPYEGIVNREELFKHLHTNPNWHDAIPFIFKYYQRDWGLCCSKDLFDTLTDASYRVTIRTTFEPGELKVGEIVIPGESEETFVLVAHLCHPAMVSDDLTGVVLGVDVMRKLAAQYRKRYYTYRLLIVPETIGSVAYLSHNENLIPHMVGGLFLESLGLEYPHALQRSFVGSELGIASQVDRCFETAARGIDINCYIDDYRTIVKNDEAQFNAPGVRVPMLSLSRAWPNQPPSGPFFFGYHSSHDTPDLASQERLETSRDLVLGLLDA
jgi:aminopeptidase-like protein